MAGDAGPVALVGAPGWHPGVMGLVAARLKERTGRPALAIAIDAAGVGTGSGRSIPGVDLGSAVRAAREAGILIKGGGHAMAAGVTVAADRLAELKEFLAAALADEVERARADTALAVDAVLTAGALNVELLQALEQAGPFGAGNRGPVVALANHVLTAAQPVGEGGHLRLSLRASDGATATAMAFRAMGDGFGERLLAARGGPIHLAATPRLDRWKGRERVELRVVDAAAPAQD
jgi:single-stranded-DNA-specific exonuclease